MECCICYKEIEKQYTPEGKMFWDQGNNALPIKDGRCCGECNMRKVLPERIRQLEERGG